MERLQLPAQRRRILQGKHPLRELLFQLNSSQHRTHSLRELLIQLNAS